MSSLKPTAQRGAEESLITVNQVYELSEGSARLKAQLTTKLVITQEQDDHKSFIE